MKRKWKRAMDSRKGKYHLYPRSESDPRSLCGLMQQEPVLWDGHRWMIRKERCAICTDLLLLYHQRGTK